MNRHKYKPHLVSDIQVPQGPGHVYVLVREGTTTPVKIGMTTGKVARRLAEHQTSNPDKLVVAFSVAVSDAAALEAMCHQKFAHVARDCGTAREWFNTHVSDVAVFLKPHVTRELDGLMSRLPPATTWSNPPFNVPSLLAHKYGSWAWFCVLRGLVKSMNECCDEGCPEFHDSQASWDEAQLLDGNLAKVWDRAALKRLVESYDDDVTWAQWCGEFRALNKLP